MHERELRWVCKEVVEHWVGVQMRRRWVGGWEW